MQTPQANNLAQFERQGEEIEKRREELSVVGGEESRRRKAAVLDT